MFLLLDPAARPVVAHRGNSAHAPEDTLESLRQGMALGADAIEFDVRLTGDGRVVVIHDPTVDRTTSGTGAVAHMRLTELQSLDAGYHFTRDGGRTFPWRGRGITISTLDAVLEEFHGTPMIVEIKSADAAPETKRLLQHFGVAAHALVGSFRSDALAPFRDSNIACTAARDDIIRLFARALLPGGPRTLPYQALCIPPVFNGIPLPVLRFAAMARRAGVCTHVWTVDDPARAKHYWDGGVNAMISNNPGALLAVNVRPVQPPQPIVVQ